jgi:2-iminobutanoate/2-iminopropanoate deaminase
LEKSKIETTEAPGALGPYSQGIAARAGTFIFVSGQLGIDPATGSLVGDTVGAQTERALANVLAIVRARGGNAASIVKTTVFLRRLDDFAAMNEVYSKSLQPPYPARSCVGGCDLPKAALVEIEAVAVVES